MSGAGRVCPLRYRYGAEALAAAPEREAETLYVVGGVYGNLPALDALEALLEAEPGPVRVVFNGDFNWFNVDDASFVAINRRVLAHEAIVGNVEAEFAGTDEAGCGCAYPDTVAADVVERSNRIHARLAATARRHPDIVARLDALPMFARYRVGGVRVGVVHGDADALAGWNFDAVALDVPERRAWVEASFARAAVDVFASTHTCTAALRAFDAGVVVNNGAAGLPNFAGDRRGLVSRVSLHLPPHAPMYGVVRNGVRIDALALPYDVAAWEKTFLDNWPPGSDAYLSYYDRLVNGPSLSCPVPPPG